LRKLKEVGQVKVMPDPARCGDRALFITNFTKVFGEKNAREQFERHGSALAKHGFIEVYEEIIDD